MYCVFEVGKKTVSAVYVRLKVLEVETRKVAPLVSLAWEDRRLLLTLVGIPRVTFDTAGVLFKATLSVTTVTPQLFVAIVRLTLTLHMLGVQGEVALAGAGRVTRTIVSKRRATTSALIGRNH